MKKIIFISVLIVFILITNNTKAQTNDSIANSEYNYIEKVTIDGENDESTEGSIENESNTFSGSDNTERIRIYSGKQDGNNIIYDSHAKTPEDKPKEKIRIYSGGQDGNNIIFDPRK